MNNFLEKIKNLTKYGPGAAAAAAGAAAGSTSGATAAGIGSTVASGVAGGIGLISSIGNLIQNYKAREQNQANWRETLNYQKELNNILMNREDTAIQRRAADLEAAGINPMLAGLGGASATPGGIINPLQQQNQPIDVNGVIQGLTSVGSNLNEIANREFSATEAEKNRLLEQQRIDIERFNAETSRLQEQNTKELNAINERLKSKELDLEEQKELNAQKNFYDQMAKSSQEFAETIKIQKRTAKTAEDRQAMDELNSETQRALTRMQGIALSSEMSNEEKRVKLQEEKQQLEAKFKKSENRRAWTDTIWGNFNKTIETVSDAAAKFIPWNNKK